MVATFICLRLVYIFLNKATHYWCSQWEIPVFSLICSCFPSFRKCRLLSYLGPRGAITLNIVFTSDGHIFLGLSQIADPVSKRAIPRRQVIKGHLHRYIFLRFPFLCFKLLSKVRCRHRGHTKPFSSKVMQLYIPAR